MILVHHDRNVRIHFHGAQNQVAQKRFPRIFSCPGRRLHDDRTVGFVSRLHDGLNLLQIIDIESRYAITVFCSVIENLAHGNEWHESLLLLDWALQIWGKVVTRVWL
jgi:hypothetical protein